MMLRNFPKSRPSTVQAVYMWCIYIYIYTHLYIYIYICTPRPLGIGFGKFVRNTLEAILLSSNRHKDPYLGAPVVPFCPLYLWSPY